MNHLRIPPIFSLIYFLKKTIELSEKPKLKRKLEIQNIIHKN